MQPISSQYTNYVNSFYSNDPNILTKRKNQAKKFGIAATTVGAVSNALYLLPKAKCKSALFLIGFVSLLTGINSLVYAKNTNKKIESITNATQSN